MPAQTAAKTGTVQTEADRAALAQAEQAVEDTREVVKLVQAEADATRMHQTIIRYTEIARALGPEGVRSQDAGRRDAQVERRVGGYRQRVGLAAHHGWRRNVRGVRWRPPGGVVQRVGTLAGWRGAIQMTLGAITGSKAVVLGPGRHTGRQQPRWVGQGGTARFRKDSDGGVALQHGHAGKRMHLGTQIQVADGVVA